MRADVDIVREMFPQTSHHGRLGGLEVARVAEAIPFASIVTRLRRAYCQTTVHERIENSRKPARRKR